MGFAGCFKSFAFEALREKSSSSVSEFSLLDAWTPIDLIVLDPDGWGSCISLVSDLGFVAIEALLFDFISLRMVSSLLSISSLIFSILSLFFCSNIWVQAWISVLIWLGSTNCTPMLVSTKFSWTTVLWLVKVILPVFGVSTWVLSTLLSGEGVSSLLDLLFRLFPISSQVKMFSGFWGRIWIIFNISKEQDCRVYSDENEEVYNHLKSNCFWWKANLVMNSSNYITKRNIFKNHDTPFY